MDLMKILVERYGYNEPIFVNEIKVEEYSRASIFQTLKRLTDSGELIRFDAGVYYIPTKTIMGTSVINPRKVMEKRFISSAGKTYGYYSGLTLENNLGLSTQVPNIIEIVSNKESAKVRDIKIGNQTVRIRKARTEINETNAVTLQFLDLMNRIELSGMDDREKKNLNKYIKSKKLTRMDLFKYTRFFPTKTASKIIESGIIYELA